MPLNKELKSKIEKMAKVDQDLRKRQWKEWKALIKKCANKKDPKLLALVRKMTKELLQVDKKNTFEMKKIISKYGWPGKSLVGKRGSLKVWLLVQHADHNVDFQEECLKLLTIAAEKGEVDKKRVAYLTDRVLLHRGKKQIYGTQLRSFPQKGKLILKPQPIKNKKRIDERRKDFGLEPLEVYLVKARKKY